MFPKSRLEISKNGNSALSFGSKISSLRNVPAIKYRISGHETFACRYAWLPKVVVKLDQNQNLFQDEDRAMVRLGVGKNMVHSAKFWAEAAQIIQDCEGGRSKVSHFGRDLLGHDGYDPFLEHPETLWLLHWKISTNPTRPLFHWQQLLNFWHRPEFTETEALSFLEKALPKDKEKIAKRTLSDGFRVFVNSYVPSRNRKNAIAEDNLDCPLVELNLIRNAGERRDAQENREIIYAFNHEPKPTITTELFAYCLVDFWKNNPKYADEKSLPARAICSEPGSPGQVFKLPELSVTHLLEGISTATQGCLVFEESQTQQQVWLRQESSEESLLETIYPSPI